MIRHDNYSLKTENTLQLPAEAKVFFDQVNQQDLPKLAAEFSMPELILGGGSNILLTRDLELVIRLSDTGYQLISETQDKVQLEISSGMNWHRLVSETVANHWLGIENLALIPGTVGAAPVQNIGAYGQELKDVVLEVEVFDWLKQDFIRLDRAECQFGYRQSIFKQTNSKLVVTGLKIELSKQTDLNLDYYSIGGLNDSLKNELSKFGSDQISQQQVFEAVINIRKRKLPDWNQVPTVGSFFVNPVVSKKTAEALQQQIPDLQLYPVSASEVKVPVGRILDYFGWRGKQIGNCRVTKENAAIFTHNGKADGREFLDFIQLIKQQVYDKVGLDLDTEVRIY